MFVVIIQLLFHFDVLSRHFKPGFESNFEVHYRQERVYSIFFLNDPIEDFVVRDCLIFFVHLLLSLHVYRKLSSQLEYLHFLINLHVPVLSPHAPVEHLVEVDIAVITLDGHSKEVFLQISIIVVFFTEAHSLIDDSKRPEKTDDLILLDFEAFVLVLSELLPDFHERNEVDFELTQHVVICQVVLFELLDDNQDEQVEHDVGANQDQKNKVDKTELAATSFALDAALFFAS